MSRGLEDISSRTPLLIRNGPPPSSYGSHSHIANNKLRHTQNNKQNNEQNSQNSQNPYYPLKIGFITMDPRQWSITSRVVSNIGSTTRDHLANERNFLATLKLSMTLATVGATLLIQFHFTKDVPISDRERAASFPLGIVIFSLSIIAVIAAAIQYFKNQSQYVSQRVFVETGLGTQIIAFVIGAIIAVTSVVFITLDKTNLNPYSWDR